MKKFLPLVALIALVGCGGEANTTPSQAASLPANLIVTTAPPDAKDVAAAKQSLKSGDAVVIRGRIGGAEKPLADNRAIMTIMDLSMPTCDKTPMEKCPTPWDSCCEPVEVRTAKSATVQVVGTDGKPLRATLAGVGGIAPNKQVIVAGIAKPIGGDAVIIEAKQIYVSP
jgi:hypothetical protein